MHPQDVWIGRWCSKTGHTGWLLVLLDEDVLASRNDGADADKDDGEAALSAAARERALLGPLVKWYTCKLLDASERQIRAVRMVNVAYSQRP
eukprot:scaffold50399_cov18-Tisochrysis_lutea.AAC.4